MTILDNGNSNINIDGAVTQYTDFGGSDTYTILPSMSADVEIIDNNASTINLPAGLDITDALFLANGVQFTINGNTLTLLGDPSLFTFVFGGTPLDPSAGTALSFDDTAAAFGTTVPAAGAAPNAATTTGAVQDDGTVGGAAGSGGQTFTLTENSDIIPGLLGSEGTDDTSGDDTIIAGTSATGGGGGTVNNLGSGDVINGGEGFNTLNIFNESGSTIFPNLENVQQVNVQTLVDTDVDFINSDGVEQLWMKNGPSGNDLTSTSIGDDLILGIENQMDAEHIATFLPGAILDGTLDVALVDAPMAAIDVDTDNAAVTTLKVLVGGDDNSDLDVSVSGSTIQTVIVEDLAPDAPGTGDFLIGDGKSGGSDLTDVTSLDSTGFSNFFETDLENNDSDVMGLFGDGGNDIILGDGDNDLTGGEGSDSFELGDGNNTADTGGGADYVEVGKGDNDIKLGGDDDILVMGTTLDEDDAADGGEGDMDTLSVDVDTLDAITVDDKVEQKIDGFERLEVTGTVEEGDVNVVDLANLDDIMIVDVDATIEEGAGTFESQTIDITGPADANGGVVLVEGVEIEIAPNASATDIGKAIADQEADIILANPDIASVTADMGVVTVEFGVTGDQPAITAVNSMDPLASGATFGAPAEVNGTDPNDEVQTIEVTTAPTSNGNVTVTVNATAVVVAVVGGETTFETAIRIADAITAAGVTDLSSVTVVDELITVTFDDDAGDVGAPVFADTDTTGAAATGTDDVAGAGVTGVAETQTVEVTGGTDTDGGLVEVGVTEIEVAADLTIDELGAAIQAEELQILADNPEIVSVDYNTATNELTFGFAADEGDVAAISVIDSADTKTTGATFVVNDDDPVGMPGDVDGVLQLDGFQSGGTVELGTANSGVIDVNVATDTTSDELNIELSTDQVGDVDVDDFDILQTMDLIDGNFDLQLTSTGDLGSVIATGEGSINFTNSFADLTMFDGSGAGGGTSDTGFRVDTLTASDATLIGGSDDDSLSASDGDDTFDGGAGDDALTGFGGADNLTGGDGVDTFIYSAASDSSGLETDTIADFLSGTDLFDLTALLVGPSNLDVEYLGEVTSVATADTAFDDTSTNLQVVFNTSTNELLVDANSTGDVDSGDLVVNLTGVASLIQDDFV